MAGAAALIGAAGRGVTDAPFVLVFAGESACELASTVDPPAVVLSGGSSLPLSGEITSLPLGGLEAGIRCDAAPSEDGFLSLWL